MRRLSTSIAVLAALIGLAACARFDPEQARICRLVPPALEPEGAGVQVLNALMAEDPHAVRVYYRATAPEAGGSELRSVTCRFAGSGYATGRLDLAAVEGPAGALSDIKLHILKRWWLPAVDGPATAAENAVPLVAVALTREQAYAAQLLINAVPLAAIEALLALAYAMVYGLLGRILFGFGEVAVLGGYAAVAGLGVAVSLGATAPVATLPTGFGLALGVSALAALAIAALLGRLLARPKGLGLVVATVGLLIAIPEALRLTQGAGDLWVQPLLREPVLLASAPAFGVTFTPMQALVGAASGLAMLVLFAALAWSRAGRHWRAVAEDPATAGLLGVDRRRVFRATFAASGVLAGLAGFLLVVHYGGIGFASGLMFGLKALLAAVVGGVGSLAGAALAGALIGVVETLWAGYFALAYRDIAVLTLLVLLLVLRPGGLLGFADRSPRPV